MRREIATNINQKVASLSTLLLLVMILTLLLFPFDFARLRLGPYYVPWVVFSLMVLVALQLPMFRWIPIRYNKFSMYGSYLFLIGLLLPLAFGRPFSPMVPELVFYLSVPLIVVNTISISGKPERAVNVLIVGASALAVFGILRIALGQANSFSFEPPKGLGTRNSAAFLLEGIYFFALSSMLWSKCSSRLKRLIGGIGALLMLTAVFLSFSRGTWISMFFGHLFVFPSIRQKVAKALKVVIVLLSALILAWWSYPVAFQRVTERAESIFTLSPQVGASNYTRWMLLVASWEKIKRDPFIGIGTGNFTHEICIFSRNGRQLAHPHNAYIQIWLENGLLGLIGFLMLVLAPFFVLRWRTMDEEGRWLLVGARATIASYTVHLFFTSFYNMLFFWAIYGLALSLGHVTREK